MSNQLITKQMLENYVADKPDIMVVIYADWCGHCRRMKEKLGNKFRDYDDLIFLEDKSVADDLKDFYPHIRIYKYGQESTVTTDELFKRVENR